MGGWGGVTSVKWRARGDQHKAAGVGRPVQGERRRVAVRLARGPRAHVAGFRQGGTERPAGGTVCKAEGAGRPVEDGGRGVAAAGRRVVQGGGCRTVGARQLAKGSSLLYFFQIMARVGDRRLTVRFRASLKHKKRWSKKIYKNRTHTDKI